jgi:bacteriocin biosynthesis cyclodehydratase domain-containing protein
MVLVWRDHTTLQVGIDDDVMVLEPVPRLVDTLLASLTQSNPDTEHIAPADVAWREWLLARLDEQGRVAAAAVRSPIRILGSGRVAARIAADLLDLGHTVHIRDVSSRDPSQPSDADRLVGHLRGAPGRPARRAIVDTGKQVALTVVCTATCEPDRSVTDALTRAGEPYIVLRTRPGRAVAGPLVVPSDTSCLRCADLWRADADPVWPRLAAQLAHQPAPDDPVLDAWVSALGLAQAVAFLYGEVGELRSRTLTLASDTGRTTLRVWPAHPRCTCQHRSRDSSLLSMPDRMDA